MSRDQLGIEKLRRMRNLFDNCNETFNQRYSVAQLEKLYDAYRECGWDITPDEWTAAQIEDALAGIAPRFEG